MELRKRLLPLFLLATAAVVPCGGTLDCYFDTANRTHLTELPRVVTCTCAPGERETFNVYDNILRQVRKEKIYFGGTTVHDDIWGKSVCKYYSIRRASYPFKLDRRGDSQICANPIPLPYTLLRGRKTPL